MWGGYLVVSIVCYW